MRDPKGVGLGEMAVSRDPEDILVAYGLGSCIGVVMIDPVTRVSGLLHAVLPRAAENMDSPDLNPFKYVESGIESMLAVLAHEGARRNRLVVRMAGGANMLKAQMMTATFDIGTRNIEAARTTLSNLKLPLTAAEVGGNTGRTVRVYVGESRVTVRVIGQKEHDM